MQQHIISVFIESADDDISAELALIGEQLAEGYLSGYDASCAGQYRYHCTVREDSESLPRAFLTKFNILVEGKRLSQIDYIEADGFDEATKIAETRFMDTFAGLLGLPDGARFKDCALVDANGAVLYLADHQYVREIPPEEQESMRRVASVI